MAKNLVKKQVERLIDGVENNDVFCYLLIYLHIYLHFVFTYKIKHFDI